MEFIKKHKNFISLTLFTLLISFIAFPVMAAEVNGCGIFGKKTAGLIKLALNAIRIIAPALVVFLGALDFFKILVSGEEKVYKDAWMTFVKRLIAVAALIFVPYLIVFILKVSGILSQYSIDNSSIFCFFDF